MKNFFKPSETRCHCGCGMDIDPRLLAELNMLRQDVGFPLVVVSGARCQKHNQAVGGARDSMHLRGLACDIAWPPDPHQRWTLCEKATKRFNGLGFYETFIHVDLRYLARKGASLWVG